MRETTHKRPLKVFLCHAHADRDPVRGLYARLTKDGVDAWRDKEKLLPGQDWELEIRKAVREADVVVVCLSKQFNQAGFRQKEVRLALDTAMEKPEGEIFIIPARLEECDNLESLRKWHWVDLFEEDGYEMLMRAFRRRADKIGATLQIKKSWLPKTITHPVDSAVNKRDTKSNTQIKTPKNSIYFIGILIVLILVISVFGFPSLFHQTELTPTTTNTATLITTTSTKSFTPTATTIGGRKGKIIFTSIQDGDSDIYMMNVDGSEVEKLTSDSDDDYILSVSPDGESVLYVSNWISSVNILNINDKSIVPLPENIVNFNFIGWSSKGDKLLYSSGYNEIYYWEGDKREIFCFYVDDSKVVNLTNNKSDDWFEAWLPNETGIIFGSIREGNREIYTVKLDGTSMTNLTNNRSHDNFQGYSLDKNKIIFHSTRSKENEIYSMGLDGADPVSFPIGKGDFKSFSPDGAKIVFESYRDGNTEIYIANIDGTSLVNLSQSLAADHFISWMPNGNRILFSSYRKNNWDLFVVNIDGTDITNISQNLENDYFVSWSPNNQKMLLNYEDVSLVRRLSNGYILYDKNAVVYLMDSDVLSVEVLEEVSFKFDNLVDVFWSPDGSKLMLLFGEQYYTLPKDVFIVELNDWSVTPLKNVTNAYWLP